MRADEELANRVRTELGRVSLAERKMFGGITFLANGKMCISVGKNRLMCRIDPAIHDAVIERGNCRTVVMKGREYRGYVHVDAEAVKSDRDLKFWVATALEYNGRLTAEPRKGR